MSNAIYLRSTWNYQINNTLIFKVKSCHEKVGKADTDMCHKGTYVTKCIGSSFK